MKTTRRFSKKIACATVAAIFSLAAAVSGSYAWFMSKTTFETEAGMFAVACEKSARIKRVRLIKFCYSEDGIGGYDYVNAGEGRAQAFLWNGESFGNPEAPTDIMNLFDPLEMDIAGTPLQEFNSNAIFEITFESDDFINDASVLSVAVKQDVDDEFDPENGDILLSSCIDFDVFTPADLLEEGEEECPFYNEDTEEYDLYMPAFLNRPIHSDDGGIEEAYFKISYLSSLTEDHAHFYGTSDLKTVMEADSTIVFAHPDEPLNEQTPEAVLYVNANYAPAQLTQFRNVVTAENTIRAYIDYHFSFTIS